MIDIEHDGQGDLGLDRVRVRLTSRNITDFILDKLADGKVWLTASLRDEALGAGLLKDSPSPGRSAHGSLLSLMKAGKIESRGDAKWRKAA